MWSECAAGHRHMRQLRAAGALRAPTPESGENLQDLLAQVDVCDGDWQVGNYNILEEIGRGGMGVIYKARQRGSRRIVALKRILSYHADNTETLVRFRREAEAAASLDHPNILPIYEVGEADDLPFFTMKLAPGGSLQSAKKALRAEPRQCVSLLERVARAVHMRTDRASSTATSNRVTFSSMAGASRW